MVNPTGSPRWYVACRSHDVNPGPVGSVVAGIPLVLFRGNGDAGALLDRCPHRNVPLSGGRVRNGALECEYHGWQFASDGRCTFAAGINPDRITRACHAPAFPVVEQQGFLWVSTQAEKAPQGPPFTFEFMNKPGYSSDLAVLEAEGSVHAVAENALDVPHTMYLHGGLFRKRGGGKIEREVEIRNYGDRAEAEYFGEERPSGLAGFILAPGGGVVRHVDRFILPSVTEVDYRLGDNIHVNVSVAMTPVSEFLTRLYAVVSFRLPIPSLFVKPFLTSLFLRIFRQDATILSRQSANIRFFGGEQFATIEADTLGPHIARLLKSADTEPEVKALKEPVVRRMRIVL